MTVVAVLALAALAIAGVSFWRLSRLPEAPPQIDERDFANLAAGDVVIVPGGEFIVASREALPAAARLFGLRSGRDRRWLLVGESGAVGLLPERPDTTDLDRALASTGGKKLDRATVDLLPGQPLPVSGGRA